MANTNISASNGPDAKVNHEKIKPVVVVKIALGNSEKL
jgi:hypothetical protein